MATTRSFRLMEMACHDSYPLNSENASPPGTFTPYLSCAEMAKPPRTASHTAASPIVNMLLRSIAAPPYRIVVVWSSEGRVVHTSVQAPETIAADAFAQALNPSAHQAVTSSAYSSLAS